MDEIMPLSDTQEKALAVNPLMGNDEVMELHTNVCGMLARIKQIKKDVEQGMIAWMEANGTDLVIGDHRYYIGHNKKYKAKDQRAAIERLLDACGGDLEMFSGLLASGAIKPGAAKVALEGDFDKHFDTITELDLKTGKPRKVLASTLNTENEHDEEV